VVSLHDLMRLLVVVDQIQVGDEQSLAIKLGVDRPGPDQEGQLANRDVELLARFVERELARHEWLSVDSAGWCLRVGVPALRGWYTHQGTGRRGAVLATVQRDMNNLLRVSSLRI
jgi:hypothetical protein